MCQAVPGGAAGKDDNIVVFCASRQRHPAGSCRCV
jgi:hypothetical protein